MKLIEIETRGDKNIDSKEYKCYNSIYSFYMYKFTNLLKRSFPKMYQKAFLFNGIGTKAEHLLIKLPPALIDKYHYYADEEFTRLGLNSALEKNLPFDRKVAEWIVSLLCDRVVYEYYLSQGIIPDIGAGYSSGIVSISGCFGAVSHSFANDIIMMNRATMECLSQHNLRLDVGIIIGLDYQIVNELFKNRFSKEELIVGSANSIISTMITGKAEAIDDAIELCLREGAIKAYRFKTGVAYHHPMMKEYCKKYTDLCAGGEYRDPDHPIISIFDNRIMTSGSDIRTENIMNVYTPIRWDLAISELENMGVTEFFDVSANGAVKKFTRVNKKKCRIYTLDEL